jgi:hypothetical protein
MSQADGSGSGSGAATNASPAAGAKGSAGKPNVDELIKAAQKEFPDKAGKIQEHHITPIYLRGDPKGPTVKIDAAYHQKITNEFRARHPYGQMPPNAARVQEIMKQVYERFPLP